MAYIKKAGEFVAEAEAALVRSTDPNHLVLADLLRSAGRGSDEFETHARQLVSLLQLKNLIEYEARTARLAEAEDAVKRARRLVDWALKTATESGIGQ